MVQVPEPVAFARVVVRLSVASSGGPALEAALGLAAALDAALEGLLVEDANLVRVAALPFASETSALTGGQRRLETAGLERALRMAAARHERRLAESAARTRVRCSFAVTRGDFLGEAAARGGDLIVVGPRADAPLRSGPVAALDDGSPEALRAVEAATRLAVALSRQLAVLVPGAEGPERRIAVAQARERLAAHDVAGEVAPIGAGLRALVAAVRARRAAVLALPVAALDVGRVDPEALAAEAACPLVLAR